jgi:hypothetical protein
VSFELGTEDLVAFDEISGRWVVHDGAYEVLVGRSSRDIRGRAVFEVRAGKTAEAGLSSPADPVA